MTSSPPSLPVSSSSDMFDKDVESQPQSQPRSDQQHDPESSDRSTLNSPRLKKPRDHLLSMTEKGDIEAYPDGINDPQNEEWSGAGYEGLKNGVTRTSTKSSWKDPGPPPDGGWVGWSQGTCVCVCVYYSMCNFQVDIEHLTLWREMERKNEVLMRFIAALGHLVIMNTWGFINSFGVFQAYYVTALNRPPRYVKFALLSQDIQSREAVLRPQTEAFPFPFPFLPLP